MGKQSKLAPVEPTSREDIEAVRELTSAIMQEVDGFPHNVWRRIDRLATELRTTFEEKLPGGFYCHCDGCNTPLGNDDDIVSGEDVTVCRDCADRYAAQSISTPAQELEDA